MKKIAQTLVLAAASLAVGGLGIAWAGPTGAQYLANENLEDPNVLENFVDDMTDDTKGKQFGKISKVVIPVYYIEFRTVSSGKAMNGRVSANATVTFANPDQAVMEAIATEGLADLKARFKTAGYEVVEPGDITAIEEYKKVFKMPSGTIAESTAQPIGWAKFQAMFVSAGGTPIYYSVPGEPAPGMTAIMDSNALDGMVWKAAGGEGVGVVRSKMVIDFVNFVADTGTTYDMEGFKKYASLSAVPQVQVWLPYLFTTRTYVFFGGRVLADDFGFVNIDGKMNLASKITGDTLGKVEDVDGKWVFTADNAKFKEAALEQIKVSNALLVGKAKTFK